MAENKELIAMLNEERPRYEALLKLNCAPGVDVETIVLQEFEYLNMLALNNPEIAKCDHRTIAYGISNVMKQNLSFDPNAGLVYVKVRSFKTVEEGKEVWKKALEVTVSANGIISVARQCGRILDYKNPEVEKDLNGKVIGVSIELLLPSVPSPRWETRKFDESDFERWKRASHKENARRYKQGDAKVPNLDTLNYANLNYTSWKGGLDPEFARAKAVRHGIKKLGVNQNENRIINVNIPKPNVVIDPAMDMQAEEQEFTSYEAVVEHTQPTPINDVNDVNVEDLG